jgi:primosomal protein N' (replication factor Y) (superfamily II helicase)
VTIVRVLPQEAAINKVFDYEVPESMPDAELVRVGTEVRIELHGRRTSGWVIATDVTAPSGVNVRPIVKVRSIGPPPEVVELAMWAAWRWGGRPAQVLRFCLPTNVVRRLPSSASGSSHRNGQPVAAGDVDPLAMALRRSFRDANEPGVIVVRTPPAADRGPLILEALAQSDDLGALIITPSVVLAENLARRLRRVGLPVALLPDEWAAAAAGGRVVIGARAAAFAPIAHPGVVIVIDEHDEAHQDERVPAWHARDIAIERARRAGVPCILTSACPTPEALAAATSTIIADRKYERTAWPIIDIVDRSAEEPGRHRLLSPRIIERLRTDERVLCVLNRTGRARLMACATCSEVARCEQCDAAVHQPTERSELVCPRCQATRPVVCAKCGGGRMKNLRVGTSRAREEIEALALRPVGEITSAYDNLNAGDVAFACPVIVGTEALLHRVDRASTVIFLDIDSDLLAPRLRAAEHCMAMLTRAARLLTARRGPTTGRLIVQTRQPQHPALVALLLTDPSRLTEHDIAMRERIGFGVDQGIALVTGEASPIWAKRLTADRTVRVSGSADSGFLIRADDRATLSDAIARVDADRPTGRIRVEVDPLRI